MIRDLIQLILDIEATIGVMGMWAVTALVTALMLAANRIKGGA